MLDSRISGGRKPVMRWLKWITNATEITSLSRAIQGHVSVDAAVTPLTKIKVQLAHASTVQPCRQCCRLSQQRCDCCNCCTCGKILRLGGALKRLGNCKDVQVTYIQAHEHSQISHEADRMTHLHMYVHVAVTEILSLPKRGVTGLWVTLQRDIHKYAQKLEQCNAARVIKWNNSSTSRVTCNKSMFSFFRSHFFHREFTVFSTQCCCSFFFYRICCNCFY